jgi:hypothetical protein
MRRISILFSAALLSTACCRGSNGDDTVATPDAKVAPPDAYVTPPGAPTAFRISDLDLRDPHVYYSAIGCTDATAILNQAIQKAIQTDSNADGKLDVSLLAVFRPLATSAASESWELRGADCVAPLASTSCTAKTMATLPATATNLASGTCLDALAGTTYAPYTPAISAPSGPCFTSDLGTLQLGLATLPITLRDATIAATYTGAPTTGLASGLIRGFLSEADATAIMLPSPINAPLSSLLPGGTGSCATHDDRDVDAGITGWYFYLNFTATEVPYAEN